jgi:hypothetical protein
MKGLQKQKKANTYTFLNIILPMPTFYTIQKSELDYDKEVRSQLFSLAQQTDDREDAYHFLPQEEFIETFVWVLENNQIPYCLTKTSLA